MGSQTSEYLVYDPNELSAGRGHSLRLSHGVVRSISSILHASPAMRKFYVIGQTCNAPGKILIERYEIYGMGGTLVGAANMNWDGNQTQIDLFGTCNHRATKDREQTQKILSSLGIEPLKPWEQRIQDLGKLLFCVIMADLAASGAESCVIHPLNEKVRRFYCRLLELLPSGIVDDYGVYAHDEIEAYFPTGRNTQETIVRTLRVGKHFAATKPKYN